MAFGLPGEGTRRLRLVFGPLGGAGCVVVYAVSIAVHGAPYWAGWWVVMTVGLVAAVFVGRALAPIVEWVIAGYREPG